MQTGIDLAREPDRMVCEPVMMVERVAYPLHCCANCVWYGRGGDDCDNPGSGISCKLFTPNAETLGQARALVGKLQMAYLLHLTNKLHKRLPWMERTIDQLQQYIGNRRP